MLFVSLLVIPLAGAVGMVALVGLMWNLSIGVREWRARRRRNRP
jgi:hypothetical protein